MIEWLKRNGAIIGIVTSILSAAGAAVAYGESVIDARVKTKVSDLLADQTEQVSRRLNGIQEQVNGGASDSRVIKEKLQHIEQQQVERSRSLEKQLELIIKLIEQRQ